MNYSFHPEAEEEFMKAIDFYEEHQNDLGLDFSVEVHKTIGRILQNPESWTTLRPLIRRALVHRFPFGLLYHYDKGSKEVYIVAVMHLHREPGYWSKRL